jgi:hypothetical protein
LTLLALHCYVPLVPGAGGRGPPAEEKEVRHGQEASRVVGPVLAVAVLGALTAAVLASPVGAHLVPRHEKKHVKKIAKKMAKKFATSISTEIVSTTVGPTLFVEETELVRFGPIALNSGDADVPIGTFGAGSFTLTAHAEDDATDLFCQVLIETSTDNSAFASNEQVFDDFDTGDEGEWAEEGEALADTSQDINADEDLGHAISRLGENAISGQTTILAEGDPDGTDPQCVFAGHVTVEVPA